MKIYNPSLLGTDVSGSINLTNEATQSLVRQLTGSFDNRYIISGTIAQTTWENIDGKPSNIVSASQDSSTVDFTISNGSITANLIGGVVSGSSQVVGILSSLNTYTSSNDTTNSTQTNRLDQLSTASGSAIGRLDNLETFSGSVNTKFSTLATYTGSNDTTNTTQNSRLDQLSTASGSAIGRLNNIETFSGSVNTKFSTLATYTGSNDTLNTTQNSRLDQLSTASGSAIGRLNNIETFSGSVNTKFSTLATYTGSNDTLNTTQNSRLDQLSTASGSTIGRLNNIESFTSSINTTIKTRLDAETVISGSSQVSYPNISNIPSGIVSGSTQINIINTTNYGCVVQISGDQTICGNKTFGNNITITGDLSVNGTVNYTNTCNFNVGDNIIELNYGGAAVCGGLLVKDVTAPNTTSGSLLWDGTNDKWVGGQVGSESDVLLSNGYGVVSGSAQIDASATTNWTTNVKTRLNAETVISGSSQVSYTGLSNIPSGIVSGAAQITLVGDISGVGNNTSITSNCIVNADINTSAAISHTKLDFNGSGLVSGSSQISYTGITNVPVGIISGSSQVDVTSTTNYSSVVNITTDQTIGGVKNFTSCIVGNICGNATTAGNSNCLGGTPAACNMLLCGNQTVAGVKTFSSCIVGSGGFCGTSTFSTANLASGISGGSNNQILRHSSGTTWTTAGNTDTVDLLKILVARGNDSNFYLPGNLVPWSGLSAGNYYYLSTSGNITTSAPTPNGSTKRVPIGYALTTTQLYFYPFEPIT